MSIPKKARILLLADEVDRAYYQFWKPERFQDIDLIISCGDLPARYLEFIATMFHGEVLYIPGNHDQNYLHHPPEGCINIDDRIYEWHGLRILGLGGSMRYKPGPFQYTQQEMDRRLSKLRYKLYFSSGIDILVTHAPAFEQHDGKDLCHIGFQAFNTIIERYHPSYFFHGHVHLSYGSYPRKYFIEETECINAFSSFVVEIPLPEENHSKFPKRWFSKR